MRVSIFGVGALATVMGITIHTIYGLWTLCADLVFVILFPQLVSVVYIDGTNTYGSLAAWILGLLFRLAGGEPLVKLPPLIIFPWYDYENEIQGFPFKTLSMFVSFFTILFVSYVTKYLFENGILRKEYDIFQCIVNIPDEAIALKDPPSEIGEMSVLNVNKGAEKNGKINPALKSSFDDLLEEARIEREPSIDSKDSLYQAGIQ